MNPWGAIVGSVEALIGWAGSALGISELAAILLVTAAVRGALLPVTYPLALRSRRWQAAFRRIKPGIREVRKVHKDEPRRSMDEVNRLHAEAGIGLVDKAGLLLALVQIPILVAFFQAVLHVGDHPPLTPGTWLLGPVAGALSLASTKVSGQTESTVFLAVSGVLPIAIVLWLGSGIGAYLVGFYAVTLVQSAMVGRDEEAAAGPGPAGPSGSAGRSAAVGGP